MRHTLLTLVFSATVLASAASFADRVGKEALPETVLANFDKKHPNALDVSARQKKHFGQDLYEIYFKEGEEKLIELYRVKGPFYVSGAYIDASGMAPAATFDNLKAAFSDYQIKEAVLVVNPNGPGEEFDFIVSSSGAVWSVSVDGEGKITSKEP